jgi:DNA-binding FadR family transcriptional regulator
MVNNGHRTRRYMACSRFDRCVGKVTKLAFFELVVNATMNSYYKAMLTVYQEENTKRKGKHHTANAFRPNLASIAQHSLITDTHKLDEAKTAKKKANVNI